MLETIREYGLESLALTGELPALRRWHAEYFLALAETAEPHAARPGAGPSGSTVWRPSTTISAPRWTGACRADGDPELALRLSGALAWFWYNRLAPRRGPPLARRRR